MCNFRRMSLAAQREGRFLCLLQRWLVRWKVCQYQHQRSFPIAWESSSMAFSNFNSFLFLEEVKPWNKARVDIPLFLLFDAIVINSSWCFFVSLSEFSPFLNKRFKGANFSATGNCLSNRFTRRDWFYGLLKSQAPACCLHPYRQSIAFLVGCLPLLWINFNGFDVLAIGSKDSIRMNYTLETLRRQLYNNVRQGYRLKWIQLETLIKSLADKITSSFCVLAVIHQSTL
jgi:hypothetical protein